MVIEAHFFKNWKHILDEFDFGIDILDLKNGDYKPPFDKLDIKNSIISNDLFLEI